MNDTSGERKERKHWLTVRNVLALQSVFINAEAALLSVCEGRKSRKCWTSSTLQTTDQSLHLKLSISIGLPSNWIQGIGSLYQCYTINWSCTIWHEKGGQSEEEEAAVSDHNKILWTRSYTTVSFLTSSCPVVFRDCLIYLNLDQKKKCLYTFIVYCMCSCVGCDNKRQIIIIIIDKQKYLWQI